MVAKDKQVFILTVATYKAYMYYQKGLLHVPTTLTFAILKTV